MQLSKRALVPSAHPTETEMQTRIVSFVGVVLLTTFACITPVVFMASFSRRGSFFFCLSPLFFILKETHDAIKRCGGAPLARCQARHKKQLLVHVENRDTVSRLPHAITPRGSAVIATRGQLCHARDQECRKTLKNIEKFLDEFTVLIEFETCTPWRADT